MDFIKRECLYTPGVISVNGKTGFKYADIIVGRGDEYYHAVFLKLQNFFTIMMDDYRTLPTIEMVTTVLSMLSEVEITGPAGEKIDNNKIKDLLSGLKPEQKYYKIGNYIIRTEEASLPCKKAKFLLDSTIPLDSINACITNMGTKLQISVNSDNKYKLDKYDKLFFISTGGENIFKELLCINAHPNNDSVVLDLVTEHEYFMSHSQTNGMKISGNLLWTMQVLEYSLNKDRDNPIEMRYENHSINSGKRRFFFLFSIQGIKIQNDVRFGLVTFSNESGIDGAREEEYSTVLSQNNHCYAQIAVANDSLRLAAEEAVKMVDKAITLLQILLLDDSPRSFFDIKDTYKTWEFKEISSLLSVDECFYVEDVINTKQYAILSRKSNIIAQPINVDEDFSDLFNKDNVLEDFFYLDKNKKADDLLQAIVWLSKSLKTQDSKEKIISLYNSVEFLVTGEKGHLLSQELSLDYGVEFDSAIDEIRRVVNEIQNEKLRERINGAIGKAFDGNASLQSKLESLVERLPITFETTDWQLFEKLKKNRQNLIHNKKIAVPITKQELNELFHLFSKVIIYKIIDFSNGGKND